MSLFLAGAVAQTSVDTIIGSGLLQPYNVAVDEENHFYLTDSVNHRIVKRDAHTGAVTTFSGAGVAGALDGSFTQARFNNPQGLIRATWGTTNGLLVADTGNHLLRFINLTNGAVQTLAGQGIPGLATNAAGADATFSSPIGLARDGSVVYVADSKNSVIRIMDLADPVLGVTNLVVAGVTFYEPAAVALKESGQLWVGDTRNHTVKLIDVSAPAAGTLLTLIGSNNKNISGSADSQEGISARFANPRGLLWLGDQVGLVIADTGNHTIRLATNNPSISSTNYGVATLAGLAGQPGLVDGALASAKFNSPIGITLDAQGGVLVVDRANSVVRRIQFLAPLPQVATPQIGRVRLVADQFTGSLVTLLTPIVSETFNNDITVAILTQPGSEAFFTSGASPTSPLQDTVPAPSSVTGSNPPSYADGQASLPTSLLTLLDRQPDLTIKARSFAPDRQPSGTTQARLVFRTANPTITGDNPFSFKLSSITTNAEFWYTTDGTVPTNAPPAIQVTNNATISLSETTPEITFIVRAFKNNYLPSAIVTNTFSTTTFEANRISFGFDGGVASSAFMAVPGQKFYAPVTMSLLSEQAMYSLQFNLQVTGPAARPVAGGAVGFETMLRKPHPEFEGIFVPITNGMVVGSEVVDLLSTNSTLNLLSVGWLERIGQTNLYNTREQHLLTFSLAHDTLFLGSEGRAVLGGYSFQVPANALLDDVYQIQIGRPSATSDGLREDVYVDAPTNGAVIGASPINAIKNVTITDRIKYLVGDVAPFRWFNAGDFGDTNLLNNDVLQVFISAVYGLNVPPADSDFFDAMDASDGLVGAYFDGDDTTINAIALGDGSLNVDDVFVVFRRSLDPTLANYVRYRNAAGNREAELFSGSVYRGQANQPAQELAAVQTQSTGEAPAVRFVAGDALAGPGQTLQIPISAQIRGDHPLRVLMLNLNVRPLDGSPVLTQPVQFVPAAALGQPTVSNSQGPANFAAAWLNRGIAGLGGNVVVGTLVIQVPDTASPDAAYAIAFEHVSGSPNGLAVFPKQVQNGLVTLSDRSASTFGDGIPDSWRLRHFGSLQNLLSLAHADADGDGVSNWAEFRAGTDPNDPESRLRVRAQAEGQGLVLRWPSVSGKKYVIEYSTSLFSNDWLPVSGQVTGTGGELQFQDASGASDLRFYRVRLAEESSSNQ